MHRLSSRVSFALAVIVLFAAAALRLWNFPLLPAGFNDEEVIDIRIVESVRQGRVEIFYDLGGIGHEGLYHFLLTASTTFTGSGSVGYRMLSLWAGLITLAAVYALGARLFGRSAGVAAMALMAFAFLPLTLSRLVGPESILPLVSIGILLALAVALPVYRRRRRRGANTAAFSALGVAMGLALYVHPISLFSVLAGILFIAYLFLSPEIMSKRRRRYVNFALLLMIIIAMPYITSSLRQTQLNGITRLLDAYDGATIQRGLDGLVGLFITGDANPAQNLPRRPVFDPVTAALILAGLAIALRGWRQPRFALLLMALLLLLPGAIFWKNSPNFIAYGGLLPVLALLFGLGFRRILDFMPDRRARWAAGGALVALLAVNLAWTARDFFTNWPERPNMQQAFNARLGHLANYLDRVSDDVPMVVCGWTPQQSPSATQLTDVQLIDLMTNRSSDGLRYAECSSGLVFTNGGARQRIILPDPTIRETAHAQVRAWLQRARPVDVPDVPDGSVLEMDVVQELADALGVFTVNAPVAYPPEAGGGEAQVNPPISFGGNLTLLGYSRETTSVYEPGSILTLVTYWRADGVVPPDLRLFTHILADPGARPPANTDTISVSPRRLRDRDVFIQVTYVPLPQAMPPGEYRVSIGAYQFTSDIRLDTLDDGQPRGTRLFLYSITISDPDESG